ncbi:hypothetical protein FB451DRAFT_1440098 [Mycena latifolia]|nr:hypothetical protein FB451DRAFT_1440098 [Mycena latifolia]
MSTTKSTGAHYAKGFAPSLKRKTIPQEDDIEEPHKKSTGSSFRPRPLQASNANAIASTSTRADAPKSAVMLHPLTRHGPPIATHTTRGRAPPVSTAGVGPARVLSCSALGKTSASGSSIAAAAVATPHHVSAQAPPRPWICAQPGCRAAHHASRVQSRVVVEHLRVGRDRGGPPFRAGANAQLVPAQVQRAALQAELDTTLRARRAPSKKRRTRRCMSALPPAHPKPVRPFALPCDWRRRPSARLTAPRLPVYHTALRSPRILPHPHH